MSEMDDAYRRDYADKNKMRELREALEVFVADPPSRMQGTRTLDHIERAASGLRGTEAHIVAVWE